MPSPMDFGTIGKSANMKRKQSSSLLAALGKPPRAGYNAPPSSYAPPAASYTPSISSSDESHETTYYAESSRSMPGPAGGRSVSSSTANSISMSVYGHGHTRSGSTPRSIRRVDDVYSLVRERLVAWSYLMQWYNGDVPWLNSVHVARSALESALGAKMLDTLARQEYALGLSLAAIFDITGAGDFLRAVVKLLDEWESWAENSERKGGTIGPLRNFFRPQRAKMVRPSAATNTATAEVTIAPVDATSESFLVLAVMPFTPDYFQVHASTCSIVRDVYKKFLAMILPAGRGRNIDDVHGTLLHPSTFVWLGANGSGSSGPAASPSTTGSSTTAGEVASDAALLGEMPIGHTLVGEGQKLTPGIIDLLNKVDLRLKRHYAFLVGHGDTIARKVLEDEFAALSHSLSGGPPLRFNPPTPGWIEA